MQDTLMNTILKHSKTHGEANANPFLIRSWLIFPAIKERFLKKILKLEGVNKPDAVIFDLEDSVKDTAETKKKARNQLINYLLNDKNYRQKIYSNFIVGIRINNHNSSYAEKDIEAVQKINPHFVIIPKTESQRQVIKYQKAFSPMLLCIIIETLKGYDNRESILKALREYDILAIGYEDLCSELGIEKPCDFTQPNPLIHILNECIISAKKHNVILKDGPSRKYGSKKNLSDFKKECLFSLSMGFGSKVAIHPTQIKTINATFSKEKLKKHAEEVIRQFKSLEDGTFVIANDKNEMMDKPSFTLYSKALKLLHL